MPAYVETRSLPDQKQKKKRKKTSTVSDTTIKMAIFGQTFNDPKFYFQGKRIIMCMYNCTTGHN